MLPQHASALVPAYVSWPQGFDALIYLGTWKNGLQAYASVQYTISA